MKYIIEIEDEPLVRGEDTVWKAKRFRSLVFDQNGLKKLKPLKEEPKNKFKVGDEVRDDSGRLAYVLVPENENGELTLLMRGYDFPQYGFTGNWIKTGVNSATIRKIVLMSKLAMNKEDEE